MKTNIMNAVKAFFITAVMTLGVGALPLSMVYAAPTCTGNTHLDSATGLTCIPDAPGSGQGVPSNFDPYKTVTSIISFALSFLGLVAVVIILLAGFKWMTARGDDKKVAEAQKMLIQGVVGLVIILSAWVIAQWAFTVPSKVIQ